MTDTVDESITLEKLKELSENQPISRFLGFRVLELAPGYAKVSIKMKPEFLNFNGIIFGGIITDVADEAFALCVSSIAHPSVATHLSVYFLSRVEPDDELTAEGRVLKSGKRLGFAEMTVTNRSGMVVAKVTGTYSTISKK
jgi:acyl-CoA thioesterase